MILDRALFALLVAASILVLFFWHRAQSLSDRARRAERRFDLLQQLAPSLTAAATESTSATCGRVLERLSALAPSQTLLCFVVNDGRLVLGARAGTGYASFLREGAAYEGDSIVDWVRSHAVATIVGPAETNLPIDIDVVDLSRHPEAKDVGPAAGSRDRVWALAVPLIRGRGRGLSPEVLGVVYVERALTAPFSPDDLRTILTVVHLAGDALERAIFADTMRRDAEVDGLTGLLTPAAFRKRLRDEIAARRDVALFFIDSDRFKVFNDTYGHAAGDRLLRRLASIYGNLASASGGFAGRNGGDEFCMALTDRSKDAAVEMAEYVRAAVDGEPLGDGVKVTVSIGVAHFPFDVSKDEAQAADRLLEVADAQMYEAKRAGRNRVEFLRMRAQPKRVLHPGEGPIPRV